MALQSGAVMLAHMQFCLDVSFCCRSPQLEPTPKHHDNVKLRVVAVAAMTTRTTTKRGMATRRTINMMSLVLNCTEHGDTGDIKPASGLSKSTTKVTSRFADRKPSPAEERRRPVAAQVLRWHRAEAVAIHENLSIQDIWHCLNSRVYMCLLSFWPFSRP